MILGPIFLMLFLVVRGIPVVLYGTELQPQERMPFILASSVASLSIVVVIAEIGQRGGTMSPDVAAALVGAALLSLMIFPTIAGVLLSGTSAGAFRPRSFPWR